MGAQPRTQHWSPHPGHLAADPGPGAGRGHWRWSRQGTGHRTTTMWRLTQSGPACARLPGEAAPAPASGKLRPAGSIDPPRPQWRESLLRAAAAASVLTQPPPLEDGRGEAQVFAGAGPRAGG